MKIYEVRKVQQTGGKNTLSTVIPKVIVYLLGIKKGDKLVFKNENDRVYIERED